MAIQSLWDLDTSGCSLVENLLHRLVPSGTPHDVAPREHVNRAEVVESSSDIFGVPLDLTLINQD